MKKIIAVIICISFILCTGIVSFCNEGNVQASVLAEKRVEQAEAMMNSFNNVTEEEYVYTATPLSAGPGSVCLISGCAGSICLVSGCIGSICIGSGCSSVCGGSACATSGCGGSGCAGSTCAGSGCVGSICVGTGCQGSLCNNCN